jgi:anti-sigma-K factor RskA
VGDLVKLAIPLREPLHSLTGAYALDALDSTGRDRFERHLRGCASCQGEVRGFAVVAAALAEATTVVPPTGLRDRVLDTISVAQHLPPEALDVPKALDAPARRAGHGGRKTRPAARSQSLPRLALATGAAGLAAAAVLGGVTVSARNGQSAAQAQAQAIAAILTAPDARLVSAPTSAGGSIVVVASVRQGKMVFTSSGLRPLPSSRVYQLWFMGRTTRSAGLVPAATNGKIAPVLASGLAAGDKIGVTVEPAGGSSEPTTAPIVLMPLTA